ncbi:hypothetical protein PR202_ga18512 [Eleusine coracana subsp. coracana]|uniref:U-box domain-containing protein n=1 Tax=Eleusine coracana subsp. coracana TaxID=191504 RepID=A0AAV5CRL3_ELECO|nr:hypothetical protein PR202_ga18512 [Eleusine coracana subsp. coracana]
MVEKKEDEEVPCYFLCPISLQMMRDPAVAAGCEPTPNHTLRRLIQAWCAAHHNHPPQPQPDIDDDALALPKTKPYQLVTTARVASLLSQIHQLQLLRQESTSTSTSTSRRRQEEVLGELRDVAAESEWNRKLIAAVPGAVDTLISVLLVTATTTSSSASASASSDTDTDSKTSYGGGADEALEILTSLQLSLECLARVLNKQENDIDEQAPLVVDALVSALEQRSNTASREHAARLLADVTAVMSPTRLASLPEQVFREVVQLLRDNDNLWTKKACLHVLVGTTSWGRNRVKAVDAGAVAVLVDMMMLQLHHHHHDSDRPPPPARQRRGKRERIRLCELALAALDRLCGCAEGRAALVAHPAGVAVVGSMLCLVSHSDKAVRVLRSVAKHAATPSVDSFS